MIARGSAVKQQSAYPFVRPALRHRSEQYRTSSQLRRHFLRQVNGRPQTGQTLEGSWSFFRIRDIRPQPLVRRVDRPPSTLMICPVIQSVSGESRKPAILAISSGEPSRGMA